MPIWIPYVVIILIVGWRLFDRWRIVTGRAKEMICPTCDGTGLVRREERDADIR